jgi:DNA replication and repair protein RecF
VNIVVVREGKRKPLTAVLRERPEVAEGSEAAQPETGETWLGLDVVGVGTAKARGIEVDNALGSTRAGPHRADVGFAQAGRPIAQRLSRGQLKLWIGALMLTQALVIARAAGSTPVLLVDDLVSDLDSEARGQLLAQLARSGCQLLVTTTDPGTLEIPGDLPLAVFHVKHGDVQQTR